MASAGQIAADRFTCAGQHQAQAGDAAERVTASARRARPHRLQASGDRPPKNGTWVSRGNLSYAISGRGSGNSRVRAAGTRSK